MTPLILVRPRELEPKPQFNLQSGLRTLAVLSRCSSNLKELSASISQAVSRMTSQSSSSAEGQG